MIINRIGLPEETPCPDCGHMIEGAEDVMGFVYRCERGDCGSMFDARELFPEEFDDPEPRPKPAMPDGEVPATSWAVWAWQAYRDGRLVAPTSTDTMPERAERE